MAELITCCICSTKVTQIYHNQVTCLKKTCKLELKHLRKFKPKKPFIINCKKCNQPFLTYRKKTYCGEKCLDEVKRIRLKITSLEWARKKNGTLQKWVKVLEEHNYTIIPPPEITVK